MSKIRARDGSACDGGPACPASQPSLINPTTNHDYRLSNVCMSNIGVRAWQHFTAPAPKPPSRQTERCFLLSVSVSVSASASAIQSHVYSLAPPHNPISHHISPDAFQTHLPPCLHVQQGTGISRHQPIQTPCTHVTIPTLRALCTSSRENITALRRRLRHQSLAAAASATAWAPPMAPRTETVSGPRRRTWSDVSSILSIIHGQTHTR
jgi:hypothetical protein